MGGKSESVDGGGSGGTQDNGINRESRVSTHEQPQLHSTWLKGAVFFFSTRWVALPV